jgi:molybdopterin synthase sulfur carrier subunit
MAHVTVRIPPALSQLTACEKHVEVTGGTAAEALRDLVDQRPALAPHLFDESGSLRRLVLCFYKGESIRTADELKHPLEDGDTLTIVNSVAGG